MNLADAIRQAALRQSDDGAPSAPLASAGEADSEPTPAESSAANAPSPDNQVEASTMENYVPQPAADAETWKNDTGKLTIEAGPDEATRLFAADSQTGEPVAMPDGSGQLGAGNVVRFEIFLSPEQLSCLFRALVATQHSMLTLREAAHYLRIPANALEQLAVDGKIPALQFEGRWRFPKSGMDEWVMLQSFREGEVTDAA